jgi:hypothetical protein
MTIKLTFILIIVSIRAYTQESIDTTFIQENRSFKVEVKKENDKNVISVLSDNELTLIDSLEDYGPGGGLDILDFDKDGFKDILFTMIGNRPVTFLYRFDNSQNVFKKVIDFEYYPQALAVDGQNNLYYSYHASGCADADWDSDLFAIKNFEIIHLGIIHAQGCEFKSSKIEVSKVVSGKKVLIETQPYNPDKWDFIANYWKNNFQKVIK